MVEIEVELEEDMSSEPEDDMEKRVEDDVAEERTLGLLEGYCVVVTELFATHGVAKLDG